MRKLYLFILMFIVSLSANVYAEGVAVVDEPDYLTISEEVDIETRLDEIKARYNIDVAVVIVESLDGKSAMSYADDYYDYNGYGLGENDDGLLLLVSKSPREYHISTYALAVAMFNDSALDYIGSSVEADLRNDDYYEACVTFTQTVDDIAYSYTESGGEDTYQDTDISDIIMPVFAAALFAAIVMTSTAYKGMNTAREQTNANIYTKAGSMNITKSNDIFLYSNVVKTKVESSSSGGGGRTHRSSSGRRHGGRGGRY